MLGSTKSSENIPRSTPMASRILDVTSSISSLSFVDKAGSMRDSLGSTDFDPAKPSVSGVNVSQTPLNPKARGQTLEKEMGLRRVQAVFKHLGSWPARVWARGLQFRSIPNDLQFFGCLFRNYMSAFHGDLSIVTRTYTRPSFNRSTGSIEEIHVFWCCGRG